MNKRPKYYRRVLTGASLSTAGAGVSTSLIASDAGLCQALLDVIDDKRAFYDWPAREDGARVVSSLSELRKMATATISLLASEEGVAEVKNIATACRKFMSDYDPDDSPAVLETCLEALRFEVGASVEILRSVYSLPELHYFETSKYYVSSVDILEGGMED